MNIYSDYIKCALRYIVPDRAISINQPLPDDMVCNNMSIGDLSYRRKLLLSKHSDYNIVIKRYNGSRAISLTPGQEYDLRPGFGPGRTYDCFYCQNKIRNVSLFLEVFNPLRVKGALADTDKTYQQVRSNLPAIPEMNFNVPLYLNFKIKIKCNFTVSDTCLFLSSMCRWQPMEGKEFADLIAKTVHVSILSEFNKYTNIITADIISSGVNGSYNISNSKLRDDIVRTTNNLLSPLGVMIDDDCQISLIDSDLTPTDLANYNSKIRGLKSSLTDAMNDYWQNAYSEIIACDTRQNIEQNRNYIREFLTALLENKNFMELLLMNRQLATDLIMRAQLGESATNEAQKIIDELANHQYNTLI